MKTNHKRIEFVGIVKDTKTIFNMKTSTILFLIATAFLPINVMAVRPPVNEEYAREEFVSSENVKLPYRIMAPEDIKENTKYPLVVFLHGAGERGDDNEKQLLHGGSVFSNPVNAEKYPAFVVFPQCKEKFWTENINERMFMPGAPTPNLSKTEASVMELVNNIIANNPIDTQRIYIVGISMGGVAAYDLACRYPQKFAAAVPICGAVNPERLPEATEVSFMIFQGEDDEQVPSICGRQAYKALNSAGANVEYVEFSGIGHDCWDSAFNYYNFLPWLFSQSKADINSSNMAENK